MVLELDFMIRAEADACDVSEGPWLSDVIAQAERDYRTAMQSDGDTTGDLWGRAAVFDFARLMDEAGSDSDERRLAVIGVALHHFPGSMTRVMYEYVLGDDHDVESLRGLMSGLVDADRLFDRVDGMLDRDPSGVFAGRRDLAARASDGILLPLSQNVDTSTAYQIESMMAVFSLVQGDAWGAGEHAKAALWYDPDDRVAAGVLERLPENPDGDVGDARFRPSGVTR